MSPVKRKTVFTAEPEQLREIQDVVKSGLYRSVSELLREAIDEKLQRIRRSRLESQVESYVAEPSKPWEDDLLDLQAFDPAEDAEER